MSNRKIKVCMVAETDPLSSYGGGALQGFRLHQVLLDNGIDSVFVAPSKRVYSNKEKTDLHFYPYKVNHFEMIPKMGAIVRGISLAFQLNKLKCSYNLLHFHGFSLVSAIALILLRSPEIPILTKMTLAGVDDPGSLSKFRMGNLILSKFLQSDRVVSTSGELTTLYKEVIPQPDKRLVEIPNGVDLNKFQPLNQAQNKEIRSKLKIPDENIVFIFVGKLDFRKGIDILADAWDEVRNIHQNVSLLLLGPLGDSHFKHIGLFNEPLNEHLIKDFGIYWLGEVEQVENYLSISDVFLLPTRQEGFPNALLEAMAMGLPPIVSKLPFVETLPKSGTGVSTITPGSSRNLADEMLSVIRNPRSTLEKGLQARKTVESQFSLEDVGSAYLELYRDLIVKNDVSNVLIS